MLRQGGFKAVVWTDVFQMSIMLAGFLAVIVQSVRLQGGVSVIFNNSADGGRLNLWEWVNAFYSVQVKITPFFTKNENVTTAKPWIRLHYTITVQNKQYIKQHKIGQCFIIKK